MPLRNIFLLAICQMISATGAITMVILGGIIGAKLISNPSFATLPVSIMVISVAVTTIPATIIMRRIGRRRGFAMSSLSAGVACLVAGYALYASSFAYFVLAAFLFGINMAFSQQYRYAAAESVPPTYSPRAISLVLLGAIGGAVVGRLLVEYGQFALPTVQYAGTLIWLAGLYVLQSTLILLLGPLRGEEHHAVPQQQRSLREIAKQRVFMVAVLGGTVAYGVMTFIMTATPLSMHINDGYSLDHTGQIIQSHVIAMYAPSLISGYLIERLGIGRMMFAGSIALVVACLIGLQGQSMMHYWLTLVLLGIGWNFLYVGGTTMLTLTYSMAERFKAQAVNEFCVFGTSATGSLLAGAVMFKYGWYTLVIVPLPLLALIILSLFIVRKNPLLRRTSLRPT